MDGTLVDVAKPSENEADFVDRRGAQHHSLNVLAVSDSHFRLLYVNSNNPGRAHDANCFAHSALAQGLAAGNLPFEHAILLGDSGYPCTEHVITPILGNNLTPAQQAFNRSHKRSRVVVEQVSLINFD